MERVNNATPKTIQIFLPSGERKTLDELKRQGNTGEDENSELSPSFLAAVTGKIDVRDWKVPDSEPEAEVA